MPKERRAILNKKQKKTKIAIACIIIFIAVLTFGAIPGDKSSIIPSVCSGILTSIIASSIFYVMSIYAFDSNDQAERMVELIDILSEKETLGIRKIINRGNSSETIWLNMLKQANGKLLLSGRTLNRWLQKNLQDEFVNAVNRVIKQDGEVSLVIYETLTDEQEKTEKEELKKLLEEKVFPNCVKRKKNRYTAWKKENIKIYEVPNLPYIYTANDFELIVSQYFKYEKNENNIMLQMYPNSSYGATYENDFNNILRRDAKRVNWLEDYISTHNAAIEEESKTHTH